MNTVEPIRDEKKIKTMKAVLKDDSTRNYLLFTLGINTGLRISDLLKLKIYDAVNNDGTIKDCIHIREKKTGKENQFVLNKTVKEAIQEYVDSFKTLDMSMYLFKCNQKLNIQSIRKIRIQRNGK